MLLSSNQSMEVEGLTNVASNKVSVANHVEHGKLHPRRGLGVQGIKCLHAGMKPLEALFTHREVQDDVCGLRDQFRP